MLPQWSRGQIVMMKAPSMKQEEKLFQQNLFPWNKLQVHMEQTASTYGTKCKYTWQLTGFFVLQRQVLPVSFLLLPQLKNLRCRLLEANRWTRKFTPVYVRGNTIDPKTNNLAISWNKTNNMSCTSQQWSRYDTQVWSRYDSQVWSEFSGARGKKS